MDKKGINILLLLTALSTLPLPLATSHDGHVERVLGNEKSIFQNLLDRMDLIEAKLKGKDEDMDLVEDKLKEKDEEIAELQLRTGEQPFQYSCAAQDQWGSTFGSPEEIISYDKLLFSTQTDGWGHGVDTSTGVFTSQYPGIYMVSWSLQSETNTDSNIIYLKF